MPRPTSASTRVEVEHFVAAQTEGVGIRVIRDGRTGFAYAGVLDETAVAEVLAEARDNVQFGTPDEWAGLAEPDGVEVIEQDLWSDALARIFHRRKDRAGQGAGAADTRGRFADPRRRCQLRRRRFRVGGGDDDGHSPNGPREWLLRRGQHAGRRR